MKTLWHGSKSGIHDEIKPISRSACDFGAGFYIGESAEQTASVCIAGSSPTLYQLSLGITGLNVYTFDDQLKWLLCIAHNREIVYWHDYVTYFSNVDVMQGLIADDRMFGVLLSYFQGNITDFVAIECLKMANLGMQIVCKTERACSAIKILNAHKLTPEEVLSANRHRQGVKDTANNLAIELQKKYRRTSVGRYFDEIIKDYPSIELRK